MYSPRSVSTGVIPALFERLVDADLLADHRFALGHRLGAEPPANLDDGRARLLRGPRKMHMSPRLRDLGLIALEIEVEMRERVILDVARRFAQRLEFRQPVDRALALSDEIRAHMSKRALQLLVLHGAHGIALESFGGGMNGHDGIRCGIEHRDHSSMPAPPFRQAPEAGRALRAYPFCR